MPYFTTFDGAAGTVVGAADGWTLIGNVANNFAQLDGAGGLRVKNSGGLQGTTHNRLEATADHFAQVVLGTNLAFTNRLCYVRANTSGDGWGLNYNAGASQLRLLDGNTTITSIPSSACVAGDTVRIEASGADQIRVYRNGALIHTRTDTKNAASTRVGFRAFASSSATPDYDDVIRSFESGAITPSDTTAPVITSLTLTATSPSTLTGEFTSDEAGLVSAVLYLAADTEPTDAQVVLGNGADDLPAPDSILSQTMTVGANSLLFTGAEPETPYKFKAVARDAAANVATGVAFSGSTITPALPKKATVTLYAENGTTPNASVTGLQWAWWDSATPDFSLAPTMSGASASTTAGGVFSVTLTSTTLATGQAGTLLVYKTDGIAASTATLSFCGPLTVVN